MLQWGRRRIKFYGEQTPIMAVGICRSHRRRSPLRVLQEALAEILSRLEMAQRQEHPQQDMTHWRVAVSASGVPRVTQGFDFAIAIDQSDP